MTTMTPVEPATKLTLADVTRGVKIRPPATLVYGPPGVGKTTWACAARNPLLIQTEDGAGLLDVPRVAVTDLNELRDIIRALANEEHDYQTVILDSADRLEPMVWKFVSQAKGHADVESFGYGKGYVYAADEWRVLLAAFDALRNRGMEIIIIVHDAVERVEPPDSEPYTRHGLKLHKHTAALLVEWAENIFRLAQQVLVRKEDAGFGRESKQALDGDRVLYTAAHPARVTKNRFGLPDPLPVPFESPRKPYEDALKTAVTNAKQTKENTEK